MVIRDFLITAFSARRKLHERIAALERRVGEIEASLAASSNRLAEIDELHTRLRDFRHVASDVKVLGYHLAKSLSLAAQNDPTAAPVVYPLRSKLCTQGDMEGDWFLAWCKEMRLHPHYHRKLWEFVYIAQALFNEGKLAEGMRGLGFGCGDEPLPSLFAKYGAAVLATDLAPEEMISAGWVQSTNGSGSLVNIRQPHICADPAKLARIETGVLDMNALPEELAGKFDFCWSACALEHLGSLAKGTAFIENSLAVLRPGGVAVHTTEFNLSEDGPTIDNWPTVLYQKKHLLDIATALRGKGHEVVDFDFDAGAATLDSFVDVPPYQGNTAVPLRWAPHLRLSIDGFPCTSVGIILRRAR